MNCCWCRKPFDPVELEKTKREISASFAPELWPDYIAWVRGYCSILCMKLEVEDDVANGRVWWLK